MAPRSKKPKQKPDGSVYMRSLWSEQESPELMGSVLTAHAVQHRQQTSGRKRRAAAQLSSYEGLTLTSMDPEQYDFALQDGDDLSEGESGASKAPPYQQTHNLGARVMDAIDAKIFALDRIKTRIVVSGGGWGVETAAVKAGRFIDGQMSEPTGMFKDVWELWRHAARLATIATGTAAVFFWSDSQQGRIVTELDDTLDMFLDTTGLAYDGFSSIGRTTFWDPEKLAARYPDSAPAIFNAADKWDTIVSQYSIGNESAQDETSSNVIRVPLIQGWKMQYGGGADKGGFDGKFCVSIPGATLAHGKYDYEQPPCVIFNPMRQLAGKWGRTILERALPAVRKYNQILNSADNSTMLSPRRLFVFDPSVTDPSCFKRVHDMMFIPHTGSMAQLPVDMTPKPFDTETIRFLLETHREAAYNLPGLNEAHATMDLGKTMSGVALRLVKNEIYEIFSPLEDEFTRCVGPETAKQYIRCAREVQKSKPGFTSIWKGGKEGGWLQEIGADVFDVLEKHKYRTEAEAVSGSTDTPASNAALAKELMETGIITGEAYARILETFNVRGQAGSELSQAEERIGVRMIDDWMYAPLDKAKLRTITPELWMDRDGMLTLRIAAAYLNARVAMVEDLENADVRKRIQLFKNYLTRLEKNAAKRNAIAAAAAAAAAPPPPAPQQLAA